MESARRRIIRTLSCVVVLVGALCGVTACQPASETGRPVAIAGGDPSGVYYSYAASLAGVASDTLGGVFTVRETQGSVENLLLVGAGDAVAGFAQGDTTVDAIRAEGSFEQALPIRAAARVYDEYVHVVVPAGSEVASLADLPGRVVSLGAEGSGVQVIAHRVLAAAGVSLDQVHDTSLGLEESIAAMQQGEIEAFFWVGGLPTPGIERLQASLPIRLLSIDAATVDRVNNGHAGVYQLADFPVGTYGLTGPTVTMTVPNYLIASATAPEQLIYELLQVLFDSRSLIAEQVPAARTLDRRQAIFTSPIGLHPGAAQYYRDARR